MLIISNKSGQLANRLILFSHFIANAFEHGYEVANPSFFDYAHYFPSIREDFFCRFPETRSRLKSNRKLQKAFFKLLKSGTSLYRALGLKSRRFSVLDITRSDRGSDIYDMAQPDFVSARQGSDYLFAKGWSFRDSASFAKHGELLRRFFTPCQDCLRRIDALIERARQDCDHLVGIHIRQGDYNKWLGGKYFFTTEIYAGMMRRYAESLPGTRVRFLICSNAPQDEKLFDGLDYIMGNNDQLEDLYSFARCDFLIGPPSTYTLWASFYGQVPLYVAEDPQEAVREEKVFVFNG
jgi:hypothetical protein